MGNKSTTKRVSKRAIEDVDLARACEKIIEPGAPIALRLQGSLLFGVSKVYQRKCQYMLSDVQKIQGHMMHFFKTVSVNQLEPGEFRVR
jgi:meiotic recombination protein REC8, fungi type